MIPEEELNSWEQKKRFHAMVRDISLQVPWAGEMMDEEEWKRLVLAGAYGQKVVPNPFSDGFVVMNNERVTGMKKLKMIDLITQLFVLGVERNVQWSNEALGEEKAVA